MCVYTHTHTQLVYTAKRLLTLQVPCSAASFVQVFIYSAFHSASCKYTWKGRMGWAEYLGLCL